MISSILRNHKESRETVCLSVCMCVHGHAWACSDAQSLSRVQLFATPWPVAHQAPLSMGLFRQEYWRGLPFLPKGDLPNPGIKPTSLVSPALQVESLGSFNHSNLIRSTYMLVKI